MAAKAKYVVDESVSTMQWIPKLVFQNSKEKYNTADNLSGKKLLILRQGKATQTGFEIAEDIEQYSGNENPVVMALTTTLKIKCIKNFNVFPFDKQVKINFSDNILISPNFCRPAMSKLCLRAMKRST